MILKQADLASQYYFKWSWRPVTLNISELRLFFARKQLLEDGVRRYKVLGSNPGEGAYYKKHLIEKVN